MRVELTPEASTRQRAQRQTISGGRYSPPLHGSPGFFALAGAAFFSASGAGWLSLSSMVGGDPGALGAGFFAHATHIRTIASPSALIRPSYRMLLAGGQGVETRTVMSMLPVTVRLPSAGTAVIGWLRPAARAQRFFSRSANVPNFAVGCVFAAWAAWATWAMSSALPSSDDAIDSPIRWRS